MERRVDNKRCPRCRQVMPTYVPACWHCGYRWPGSVYARLVPAAVVLCVLALLAIGAMIAFTSPDATGFAGLLPRLR